MSLDIRFKEVKAVLCPRCGERVATETVNCEIGGGRGWYAILESIGYYVPRDKRIEENDWYGKDMTLTRKQAEEVYLYIKEHKDIYGYAAAYLIAKALLDGNDVVVNADW